jgi:hypothetical protein
MKPTPEALNALHQSAEMLAAVVRRAEEADSLEIQAHRLRSTLDAYKESCRSLEGQLADARAENGRQAAVIAALRGVRFETINTGRDDGRLFRDWMEGDSPQSHPNHRTSPHP